MPTWRLDYLFTIASFSWIVHILVVSLTSFALRSLGASGGWLGFWLAGMLLLSVMMLLLANNYRMQVLKLKPEMSAFLHSFMTTLIGLFWGGGAIFCAMDHSFTQLSFYTLVLGGTALAAVSSQHSFLRSCILSIWTSIPPLAFAWLSYGWGAGEIAAASMMVLFGLMLSMFAVRMNGFITQNVELTNQLVEKNAALVSTTEALVETQMEKSRFLAQASHDLRQPIHAIGLFVECLNGMELGQEGEEVLENVSHSVDSLSRLCRSLLDLSALDVGRVKPKPEPTNLSAILGEVARQAEETARKRGVRLHVADTDLWVDIDPALLHTMVQNLVSNAIKYAPGSDVFISCAKEGDRVGITVRDTGAGIAEHDQSRIFKEFTQVAPPDAGRGEGLGLGLSIVRRLSDMQDLTIVLDSRPDEGAGFTIGNLREVPPVKEVKMKPVAGPENRLLGVEVLVVDDEEDVLSSTSSLFERWGCSVRVATKGDDLLDLEEIDYILSDQFLEGRETGLELISKLREKIGRKVPAAILTGGDAGLLESACKANDILLLTKPLRPAQLRSVLITGLSDQP